MRSLKSPQFLVLLLLHAMMFFSMQEAQAQQLRNGFYAVLADTTTRDAARVDSIPNTVLVYDGKYVDSTQASEPRYVAVDTSFFVPLILDAKPVTQKDGRGHTLLGVSLSRQYVGTLEKFSRVHLGGRVAIVLDGEIITMHGIRSVITGGKVQITRCYDNACEVLLSKLVK